MPYIPHTIDEIKQMLASIGVPSIDALFAEIPSSLRNINLDLLPNGLEERAAQKLMQTRASLDGECLNFIGAGAYEHYIPAIVWSIASRGEWLTSYTPYQAEASQGTLQLLYEFQSMMATLMHLEVSNASMYDGASSLAEAILMAVRVQHQKGEHEFARILLPRTIHPYYRQVVKTLLSPHNIEIIEMPFDKNTGRISKENLHHYEKQNITTMVVPQPNFFGVLEEVDEWCDFAKKQHMTVIALVNPLSMALLKPPGLWGKMGADIACGEGQSLGIPLASGGPYFGFLCCKKEYIRQMPGRLVGRTLDAQGKVGFTLTLQAREQHIRRSKATSNICTNQGLLVTAATIYMSLLGPKGLRKVALKSHENASLLAASLKNNGLKCLFQSSPFFHELVVNLNVPVKNVIDKLAQKSIQAGFDLSPHYPELGNSLLVCATDVKTVDELNLFNQELQQFADVELSRENRP